VVGPQELSFKSSKVYTKFSVSPTNTSSSSSIKSLVDTNNVVAQGSFTIRGMLNTVF
jgi:hypothetical protein